MTAEERWADMPGMNGDYQVSDQGRVRSLKYSTKHPRMLKLTPTQDGEVKFNTSTDGLHESWQVARAVAMTWLASPGSGEYIVKHRSKDLLDNRPENLYWHEVQR